MDNPQELLDKAASQFMTQWNQEEFKNTHPALYRTIISAIMMGQSQPKYISGIDPISDKELKDWHVKHTKPILIEDPTREIQTTVIGGRGYGRTSAVIAMAKEKARMNPDLKIAVVEQGKTTVGKLMLDESIEAPILKDFTINTEHLEPHVPNNRAERRKKSEKKSNNKKSNNKKRNRKRK